MLQRHEAPPSTIGLLGRSRVDSNPVRCLVLVGVAETFRLTNDLTITFHLLLLSPRRGEECKVKPAQRQGISGQCFARYRASAAGSRSTPSSCRSSSAMVGNFSMRETSAPYRAASSTR